ncbi:N-acetyltransferase [Anoxynatronum buryatiense]|uniref:Acetyltransferase (GNAT) family protein n=1 Tax=Anoxynatronum buryatiense TaxID=489973 RepID=A0AA46AJQ8_9CLOT|nr:N-acetyltransferase [Anoxynatronum buryatiense]SMP63751.1 Acetyltransferase (GNAT) family protein [Anoxynatronum buryatiense]
MSYMTIDQTNIDQEHICCAISDKKCAKGYELKKKWLRNEFEKGFVFRRINERAKVFIEYGPAEKAWIPVTAPKDIMIGCFWVSGKYKGNGHGKALLQEVITDAEQQGKDGLVTVVGTKKYHFMSDTKWLLKQGFVECDTTPAGFSLLSLRFNGKDSMPHFNEQAKRGKCPDDKGYVVYYSNRCPFTEYHVRESLAETVEKRQLNMKVIKLETMEQAQSAPTPATIFSLFYNGEFMTTDVSVCMDSRFDKIASLK